jgi:hypothetical protein
MKIQNNFFKRIKCFVLMSFCFCSIFAFMAPYAFAAEASFNEAFGIIRTVVGSFGVVAVAFCGIKYLIGGSGEGDKSIRMAMMVAFACGAIIILPEIVGLGVQLGQKYGWSPPGG